MKKFKVGYMSSGTNKGQRTVTANNANEAEARLLRTLRKEGKNVYSVLVIREIVEER